MGPHLTKTLSAARFQTYLNACAGDEIRAEELYVANMRLSGAALESIHMFEVVLRNSIDAQLRAWNISRGHSASWTLDPVPILQGVLDAKGHLLDAIADARRANARRPRASRRELVHDDVVAQFSLGTWRYLLPSQSDVMKQKLWDESLSSAFPNLYDIPVTTLVEWVAMVYDLRNRVAHFEPIFSRDLYARRRAMYRTLKTVDRDAQSWFVQHDRFSQSVADFYEQWPEHKGSKA